MVIKTGGFIKKHKQLMTELFREREKEARKAESNKIFLLQRFFRRAIYIYIYIIAEMKVL